MARNDLQGTLDLLVLKTLSQMGELHGYGIVLHIQRASEELLSVEEGSLYPALHRMVDLLGVESHGYESPSQVLPAEARRAEGAAKGGREL